MNVWLGRNRVDFKLLFQTIQKDGVDQPAVYRALIRKL
jgi:hypothetical protein